MMPAGPAGESENRFQARLPMSHGMVAFPVEPGQQDFPFHAIRLARLVSDEFPPSNS